MPEIPSLAEVAMAARLAVVELLESLTVPAYRASCSSSPSSFVPPHLVQAVLLLVFWGCLVEVLRHLQVLVP